MAGLLYFVPGPRTPHAARQALRDAGLEHVAEGAPTFLVHEQGPGGGSGTLVSMPAGPGGNQAAVRYAEGEQQ